MGARGGGSQCRPWPQERGVAGNQVLGAHLEAGRKEKIGKQVLLPLGQGEVPQVSQVCLWPTVRSWGERC